MDSVPERQLKGRIGALEARRAELEAQIDQGREKPVQLHPNMAGFIASNWQSSSRR
jgi:hypothetical protein